MFLKIMSDEHHLQDSDVSKNFTLIPVPEGHRVSFMKDASYPEGDPHVVALIGPHAGLEQLGLEFFPVAERSLVLSVEGWAYVLNEEGKTIARRSSYGKGTPAPTAREEALKQIHPRTALFVKLDPDDPSPQTTVAALTQLLSPLIVEKIPETVATHKSWYTSAVGETIGIIASKRLISIQTIVDLNDSLLINLEHGLDHVLDTGTKVRVE